MTAAAETAEAAPGWATSLGGSATSGTFNETSGMFQLDTVVQVKTLDDGSILAAGGYMFASDDEDRAGHQTDGMLALYRADHSLAWTTYVGGTGHDVFTGVDRLSSGDFVAVGESRSNDGDVTGMLHKANSRDGFIAIIGADGTLKRTLLWGGTEHDGFRDVVATSDGGFVVAGFAASNDGNLQGVRNVTETGILRNCLLAKFSADLVLEWADVVTTTNNVGRSYEEYSALLATSDGGFIAAGKVGSDDGDMAGLSKGHVDGIVGRYGADGERVWLKTYGGTGEDAIKAISADRLDGGSTVSAQAGFLLAGRTTSLDGDFTGVTLSGETTTSSKYDTTILATNHAFAMRIDKDGNVMSYDIVDVENTVASAVAPTADGDFLVAGTFKSAEGDFSGAKTYGGSADLFIAHVSRSGTLLKATTFGSDGDDFVMGLDQASEGTTLVCGHFMGSALFGNDLKGKSDGFIASMRTEDLLYSAPAEDKVTIPVVAWHASEDRASMMAPLLHDTAYAEKSGDTYKVTVYFENAVIMGQTIYSGSLGVASYDKDATGDVSKLVAADLDVYDAATQVKSVTMTLTADQMKSPVLFNLQGMMGGGNGIRLKFDMDSEAVGEAPVFEPKTVTAPDFECAWKETIGGTGADDASDMDITPDGHILVVGGTRSSDQDFKERPATTSSAYVNEYTEDGDLLSAKTLSSAARADAYAVSAAEDGYFVSGIYTAEDGAAPGGDFAGTMDANSYGGWNGFVAKFDYSHNLVWMTGVSGTGSIQAKNVKATSDGGAVVLYGIVANAAAYEGGLKDLVNGPVTAAVVKYDANGAAQWSYGLSGVDGAGIADAWALDVLADGRIVIAGFASKVLYGDDGPLSGIAFSGGTYDAFALALTPAGGRAWVAPLGGSAEERAHGAVATADGGVLVLGQTSSDDGAFKDGGAQGTNAFVAKLASDGTLDWLDCIPAAGYSSAVSAIETASGFLVVGDCDASDMAFTNLAKGNDDAFVATYNARGERLSVQTFGGSKDDGACQVKMLDADADQAVLLFESNSSDGDLAGIARGDNDGVLVATASAQEPEPVEPEPVEPEPVVTQTEWKRLWGATALDTMAAVVEEGFDSSDAVVVATVDGYWDALAASALAGAERAPVLLTAPDSLSEQAAAQIRRLGATRAYVCGGEAAVSAAAAAQIEAMGVSVTRLGGADAPATAALVSARAAELLGPGRTCVVATPAGFYDSLSAAPGAYALGMPVYLTGWDGSLSEGTLGAIRAAGYGAAVLAGGPAAVSPEVVSQLESAGIPAGSVERLGGADAWETSLLVAEWELSRGMSADRMGVADGNGYWDALTGAALCGRSNSALVLVPHDGDTADGSRFSYDPRCIDGFVAPHAAEVSTGYVFGGTAAVPEATMEALKAATGK